MKKLIKLLVAAVFCCLVYTPAMAADLSIACAANFTAAMKELSALYTQDSGVKTTCAFGSTGMLYGQIKNGAPYDVFFAADEKRPNLLYKEGLGLEPVLYAKGKVVLWTANKDSKYTDWQAAVTDSKTQKVGIANPKTAPYGLMAEQAMAKAGVLDAVTPKLVFAKNVGMAFQFAYSDSAEFSFVALSQAISGKGKGGKYWMVPQAGPVFQAACALKDKQEKLAGDFLNWLNTAKAKEIIKKYGYE